MQSHANAISHAPPRATRRAIMTVLAAGAAATVAAACGAGDAPSGGSKSAAPVTLQYFGWGDSATRSVDDTMLSSLKNRQPRISAEMTTVPNYGDYYEKLLTQLTGGTPPDVAMVNVLLFAGYYNQGAMLDLSPYVQRARRKLEDYWPAQMSGFRRDGKVWAFGRDFSPRLFFVNRTMLSRVGQTIDEQKWTWDDFVRTAKALAQGEGAGRAWGTTSGDFLTWLYSSGGAVYNTEGTRVVTDSAEAIRGIEFRGDLTTRHRVTPLAADRGGRSEMQLFTDGRIGMYMTGRWNYPTMNKITDFEWDVVLPPTGPAGRWTNGGGGGYALMKGSKHPEEGWEALSWITGEGQKDVADVIGIPAYRPATQTEKFRVSKPANDKVFVPLAEKHTRLQPQHPQHNEVDKIVNTELGRVDRGEQSPRDAGLAIAQQGTALVQGSPWKAPS